MLWTLTLTTPSNLRTRLLSFQAMESHVLSSYLSCIVKVGYVITISDITLPSCVVNLYSTHLDVKKMRK